MVPLSHCLILSATLFSIGVLGVLIRRNAIVVFMSIEIMLNAVNISLISFDRYMNRPKRRRSAIGTPAQPQSKISCCASVTTAEN